MFSMVEQRVVSRLKYYQKVGCQAILCLVGFMLIYIVKDNISCRGQTVILINDNIWDFMSEGKMKK